MKKGEMKAAVELRIMTFTQHTWPPFNSIQTMNTPALIGAEKYVTEVFMKDKEQWTKRNAKPEVADYLIHKTICHTQYLYQIPTRLFWNSCEIFVENVHIHNMYTGYTGVLCLMC